MVLSLPGLSPMRYAAAKRRVKSNPLRITFTLKTNTSSVILEILKILIQNHITAHLQALPTKFAINP
jgi:hypothetical protein